MKRASLLVIAGTLIACWAVTRDDAGAFLAGPAVLLLAIGTYRIARGDVDTRRRPGNIFDQERER